MMWRAVRHTESSAECFLLQRIHQPIKESICWISKSSVISGTQNHYAELGLKNTASCADIKQAYLKMCKEKHPDRNLGNPNSHADFVKINEAYAVLSDSTSKAEYDNKTRYTKQAPYAQQYRQHNASWHDARQQYPKREATYRKHEDEGTAYADKMYAKYSQASDRQGPNINLSHILGLQLFLVFIIIICGDTDKDRKELKRRIAKLTGRRRKEVAEFRKSATRNDKIPFKPPFRDQ